MSFLQRFDGRSSFVNKTGVTGVVARQSDPIDKTLNYFVPDNHFNAIPQRKLISLCPNTHSYPLAGPRFTIQSTGADSDYDPNDFPYSPKPKQSASSRLAKENNMDAFYEAQRLMDLNGEDDPIYSLRRLQEIAEEDYTAVDPYQQSLLELDPASPLPKIDNLQYYDTNKIRQEITSRQYGARNSHQRSELTSLQSRQQGLLKLHSTSFQSLPSRGSNLIEQRYDGANELLSKFQQPDPYNGLQIYDSADEGSHYEQFQNTVMAISCLVELIASYK